MRRASLRFVQVDAFTRTAFKGNPAAVFVLAEELSGDVMQNIAAELNLSETAFVVKGEDGYRLRWFTPTCEVELCGHATLASAHVLWAEGYAGHGETLRFHTASGLIEVKKRADHVCMDFPAADLAKAEKAPAWVSVPSQAAEAHIIGGVLLLEFRSEDDILAFQPEKMDLQEWPGIMTIITAPSAKPYRDFVSRVFAPKLGVPEDPVTGSAHAVLGPYWMKKLGLPQVMGEQLSRRTGVVHMEETADPSRVIISGQAVTMLKGIFFLA